MSTFKQDNPHNRKLPMCQSKYTVQQESLSKQTHEKVQKGEQSKEEEELKQETLVQRNRKTRFEKNQ